MDCHKLPRCPNGPGLGGGDLGGWHMVIDVPQLWDLTKSTISARKTFQGCQTLGGGSSSDSWGDLPSHGPVGIGAAATWKALLCFRWMENTPISHCSDLPGPQKWVEILLVMGTIYRKRILKFILGTLRHHLHFWVSCTPPKAQLWNSKEVCEARSSCSLLDCKGSAGVSPL